MTEDDVRDALAAVLTDDVLVPVERGPVVSALLPVMERRVAEAAGKAVRQAFVDAAGEAIARGRRGPIATAEWLLDFGRARAEAAERGAR